MQNFSLNMFGLCLRVNLSESRAKPEISFYTLAEGIIILSRNV